MSDEQKEQLEEFVTNFKKDLIEARDKYQKLLNSPKANEEKKLESKEKEPEKKSIKKINFVKIIIYNIFIN